MKKLLIVVTASTVFASGALADPVTKTLTIDKPNFEGSRTVIRDKEAGTLSRDAELTRKSDGATATRSYDRARTDDGFTASGNSTNFRGQTRSFNLDRSRNQTGATTTGTFTGRGGENYDLSGNRSRTETGFIANQSVTNSAGERVYNRDRSVSRADGQVMRSTSVTRAEGFKRPRAGRRNR
jgi:hypothetical protein